MNDTIYRRDTIQALIDTEEIKGFAYRMLEDRLMEIPSADQQQVDGAALISAMSLGHNYGIKADRPQGKWIKFGLGRGTRILFCTNCERRIEVPLSQGDSNYDFCPNCGAKMKGTDDE